MERKAFLSTWCKIVFTPKGERSCLPEHSQDLSCTTEQKELNTREHWGQDTTKTTSAPAELCIQSPLCLALMNLLLWVVQHSSSLVIMSIPMSHWDYLIQVRDRPLWINFRDCPLPPDMLAMHTAEPKWNHAKLYGFFAAYWFFLMENGEDQKGESESLPEWPSLCGNIRQRFDHFESEIWPLDDDWFQVYTPHAQQ